MLVVISDLHFMEDPYLKDRNPDSKALRLFFSQIARTGKEKDVKEILIVLNGDIFDHIRSEKWLEPDDEGLTYKPYQMVDVNNGDVLPAEVEQKAFEIHKAIESDSRVRPSLELFRSIAHGEDDIFRDGPQPRFLYIPGTSDRLANLSPGINRSIRELLNLPISDSSDSERSVTPFPNSLLFAEGLPDNYPRAEEELGLDPGSLDYALLVQHGHEYDWLSSEYNLDDNILGRIPEPTDSHLYAISPISDFIAIDLVMRLARDFLEECGGDTAALIPRNQAIYRCLLDAQDVRPQLRVLQYLMWRLEGGPWEQVRHLVRRILKDALKHPRLKSWLHSHDRPWFPDRADKIRAALAAFRRVGDAMPDSFLAAMAQKISRRTIPDKAPVDLIRKDPIWKCDEIHTLCHGHFHDPSNYNLAVIDGNPKTAVGTGTWRRTHQLCLDELSHMTVRSMNYAIFYRPEEQTKDVGYRIEFWRGRSISQKPGESGSALDDGEDENGDVENSGNGDMETFDQEENEGVEETGAHDKKDSGS